MVPLSRRIVLPLVSVLVVLCHGAFADEVDAEFDADFADEERFLQEQEVTRCNFWCQLKNSLGLTIVGLLLICIAPCLMWKNEGRHVTELRRIDFCKNKAVVVEIFHPARTLVVLSISLARSALAKPGWR